MSRLLDATVLYTAIDSPVHQPRVEALSAILGKWSHGDRISAAREARFKISRVSTDAIGPEVGPHAGDSMAKATTATTTERLAVVVEGLVIVC